MENSLDVQHKQKKQRLLHIFWIAEFALLFTSVHRLVIKDIDNFIAIIILAMLLGSVYVLAKKNKVIMAGNVLIILITSLMLTLMWRNDGIRDEVLLAFPAIACFSILTCSPSLFRYLFIAIVLNVIALACVNEFNLIQPKMAGNEFESAIVILTILATVSYVIQILGADLQRMNEKLAINQNKLTEEAIYHSKELDEALQRLASTTEQLEKLQSNNKLANEKFADIQRLTSPVETMKASLQDMQQSITVIQEHLLNGGIKRSELETFLTNNQTKLEQQSMAIEKMSEAVDALKSTNTNHIAKL